VQIELAGDRLEFLCGWFGNAEPDEGVLGPGCLVRLLEAELSLAPPALLVDPAIDDHSAQYRHRTGPTR